MSNEIAGGLVGASVGLAIAITQAVLGYRERKQSKRDAYLFQAFQYFDGGTQRRNIGIAIIEGLWQESPHLRGFFIPLLANQAIYLLTGSEQSEARHEQDNLRRIMGLLADPGSTGPEFASHYQEIRRALDDKKAGKPRAGVSVDARTLDHWATLLAGKER